MTRSAKKKVGKEIKLLRITRVTATNITAVDVTADIVRDIRTIHPRTNTKLADTKALEMTDLCPLEADTDPIDRGAETQNDDATDIARRLGTNRQGHKRSRLHHKTQSMMRLGRLLHP